MFHSILNKLLLKQHNCWFTDIFAKVDDLSLLLNDTSTAQTLGEILNFKWLENMKLTSFAENSVHMKASKSRGDDRFCSVEYPQTSILWIQLIGSNSYVILICNYHVLFKYVIK